MGANSATGEASLRRQLEAARATIARLTAAFAGPDDALAAELGLTRAEALVLGCLMRREVVSRVQLSEVLGAATLDRDPPKPEGVHVYVYRLREKLAWRGMHITSVTRQGWRLGPITRAKLQAMVEAVKR